MAHPTTRAHPAAPAPASAPASAPAPARAPAPRIAGAVLSVSFVTAVLLMASLLAGVRPAAALTGDIRVHDPSVIKVGSCFYAFSTGFEGGPGKGSITIRRTCDPTLYGGWGYVGTVWTAVPSWITKRLGSTPPNIWAPDINYVNGTYYLYYAASIWGQNTLAVTGLATATSITGPWTDAGQVTDVNYPIDPNMAWSGSTPYLMWGSWNGTYLHALNPSTGKLSTTDNTLPKIASGIENASMAYNGGYFYLFGSKGSCCSGVNSTYYTVVGRSTSISGPFLDRNGTAMTAGGGTTILSGSGTQVAAGGADVFMDGSVTRLAYHFYDATFNGLETLNVRTMTFSGGWPTLGPPVGGSAIPMFGLANAGSGKVADVSGQSTADGASVIQYAPTGGANQQWQFVDAGGGYSTVVNRNSGKCLDVSNASTADGAPVIVWACGTGANQQWRVTPVGRYLQLVARHSGKCLAVLGGSTADGAPLTQTACGTQNADLWVRQ